MARVNITGCACVGAAFLRSHGEKEGICQHGESNSSRGRERTECCPMTRTSLLHCVKPPVEYGTNTDPPGSRHGKDKVAQPGCNELPAVRCCPRTPPETVRSGGRTQSQARRVVRAHKSIHRRRVLEGTHGARAGGGGGLPSLPVVLCGQRQGADWDGCVYGVAAASETFTFYRNAIGSLTCLRCCSSVRDFRIL